MSRRNSLLCIATFGAGILSALTYGSLAVPLDDGIALVPTGFATVALAQPRTFFVAPTYQNSDLRRCGVPGSYGLAADSYPAREAIAPFRRC